jgi:hypothetical protein
MQCARMQVCLPPTLRCWARCMCGGELYLLLGYESTTQARLRAEVGVRGSVERTAHTAPHLTTPARHKGAYSTARSASRQFRDSISGCFWVQLPYRIRAVFVSCFGALFLGLATVWLLHEAPRDAPTLDAATALWHLSVLFIVGEHLPWDPASSPLAFVSTRLDSTRLERYGR